MGYTTSKVNVAVVEPQQLPNIHFGSTGQAEIDGLFSDISIPMITLNRAYNSLGRVIHDLKVMTRTSGHSIVQSIVFMIALFSTSLKNGLAGVQLNISESYPYIKFNEEIIQILNQELFNAWKKLLSIYKQLENLLPVIETQLDTVSAKRDAAGDNVAMEKNLAEAYGLYSEVYTLVSEISTSLTRAKSLLRSPSLLASLSAVRSKKISEKQWAEILALTTTGT